MQTVFQKKDNTRKNSPRRNEGEAWLYGLSENVFSYSDSPVLLTKIEVLDNKNYILAGFCFL